MILIILVIVLIRAQAQRMGGEAEQLVVSQSRTVGSGSVITFDDLVGCVASNQLWHTQFLQASRTTLRPIDGCSAQAFSQALNALYKANALEGCEPVVVFSIDNEANMRKGALEAMMVDRYFHKTADTGNTSSWQVTEAGQKLVDVSYEMAWGPRAPLLRDGIPLEDMTELELVNILENKGWGQRLWMHYSKDRDPDMGPSRPLCAWSPVLRQCGGSTKKHCNSTRITLWRSSRSTR